MNAREEILRLVGQGAGDPAAAYAALDRTYLVRHHETDHGDLLAERLADYRAIVHRTSLEHLPLALARALRPGAYLVPDGVPPAWLPPDITVGGELEEASGVITGCAIAIAETGTLVLDHGPGQGRRALTLVPDHHLVVVTADQIAADMPEALARLDITRPLTFVSGPSATSDIELSRVEGVHGPRTLEVFLV